MPPGQRYEYSSTETIYDGIEPVRTIERTFNRFHLLTSERTVQAECVTEVVTVYDDDPGTSFENQVSWCQLPVEVRTRHYRETDPHQFREDVRTTLYDAHGNVVEATDERGATETYDYFPAEGVEGECPPDALAFIRFLREKRVFVPLGSDGPVRFTRYTYKELVSRVVGDASHIVPATEVFGQVNSEGVERLLGDSSQLFISGSGLDHGRLRRLTARRGTVENSVDYAYTNLVTERDALHVEQRVLVTTATKTWSNGDDSLQTRSLLAQSIVSGLSVMDQSPNGIVMRYSHDALGRLVGETVSADTDWAATTTSTYVVHSAGSRIVKRSATGQETVVELDGFGTAIRVLAMNWNDDRLEHEIWRAEFDAVGRKVSETTTDAGVPVAVLPPPYNAGVVVPVEIRTVATTTRYGYDGWGNASEVHGADGVVGHHVVDPVLGIAERWEEAEGPDGKRESGRTRTQQTTSGKPERIDTLNADGAVCASRQSSYDGLDRLVREFLALPGEAVRVTRYGYDAYDRLVETVRPDRATITTSYAAYTDAAVVTAIAIRHASLGSDPVVLGRQVHDGLGRRTELHAGQRVTRFHYAAATSPNPDAMVLPSGETVTCRYEPHLGDLLVESVSQDGVATYVHDPKTGDTLSVRNALGSDTFAHDASGRVISETCIRHGVADEKRCEYSYSLRGKLTGYTDVTGDRHALAYDGLGRLIRMESSRVTVDMTYDGFSRVERTLTRSRDGTRSMDVQSTFDEHGRETGRVLTAKSNEDVSIQSFVQVYTPDGKLARRRLAIGDGMREETFAYDVSGRLRRYTCAGVHAPQDASGHAIASQNFGYDALDNVIRMVTTFANDQSVETRRFTYADDDPTQLLEIVVSQGGDEHELFFAYDEAGQMRYDERGRRLLYDAMGRPAGWDHADTGCLFRYDARDRIGSAHDGQEERHRYYLGGQLNREEGATTSTTFHRAMGAAVAQTRHEIEKEEVILLGGDSQGSVVAEAGHELTSLAYTPHGFRDASLGQSDIGYTGERKDRDVDWYVLGDYRAYNPAVMRFHSPDSASPFGHGGLNAYAYCAGDPVNRCDPSGEGWLDWLFVGIGIVASGIAIAASGGTLAPAIGAVVSLTATAGQATAVSLVAVDVTSVALSLGSAAAADSGNDALAGKLGLASMVLGLGGLGAVGAPKLASGAARGIKTFRGATKYLQPPMVRPRLALKAPRLRGGADGTGPLISAVDGQDAAPRLGGIDRVAPFFAPSDDVMRAMPGIDRVNAAAASPLMRRHLISRGFASPELLNRFPQGIDLAHGESVVDARGHLTLALLDEGGLDASMLARTGIDAEQLASLNPSLVAGGHQPLSRESRRVYRDRPPGRVNRHGEHLYRMFLQTGDERYLSMYGYSLARALHKNRWISWNRPSSFSF
jgi:RHS repeat-associated protein